ncbi:MAG: hypothetical protein WCS21_10240 [Lachnospiraceae bacterium]
MKKPAAIVFVVIAACLALLASEQKIIDLDDPIYGMMDRLYLSCGLAVPSGARPWSQSHARIILARIEESSLDDVQKALFQNIEHKLEAGNAQSFVSAGLTVSPEMYYHSNGEDFNLESDWVNGFTQRSPFATAKLELGIADAIYLYCDLSYGWGIVTYKDTVKPLSEMTDNWIGAGALIPVSDGDSLTVSSSYVFSKEFLLNFPEMAMIEINVPRRAVLSTGGNVWNLSFSRDRISWGSSSIGNFILDDHVPYQEYIRLNGFSDRLTMDFVCMFMDTDTNTGNSSTFSGKNQYYLLHRFGFRILPSLSLAVSENVMYRPDTAELRFFNPAYIYHQINNSEVFNAIASVELDAALAKGVRLYAQFCLDQAQAPTESGYQPDAWGILGGMTIQRTAGTGFLSFNAEYEYATPCLYRRGKVDFLMFQKWNTNVTYQRPLVLGYIGFPYGGDNQVFQISADFSTPAGFESSLYVRGIRKGTIDFYAPVNEEANNDAQPSIKGSTPYGDRFFDTLILGTKQSKTFENFLNFAVLSVYAEADCIWTRTVVKEPKHVLESAFDFQLSLGSSISI